MITKETFCKCLDLIQEQEGVNEQFSKALDLVGNGHYRRVSEITKGWLKMDYTKLSDEGKRKCEKAVVEELWLMYSYTGEIRSIKEAKIRTHRCCFR